MSGVSNLSRLLISVLPFVFVWIISSPTGASLIGLIKIVEEIVSYLMGLVVGLSYGVVSGLFNS